MQFDFDMAPRPEDFQGARLVELQASRDSTLGDAAARTHKSAHDPADFDLLPPPVRQPEHQQQPPDLVELSETKQVLPDDSETLTDLERSNLYISNLSLDVGDDELRRLFGSYGPIVNSRIMVDIHTCKPRGFAFVQYSQACDAAAALKALDGSVYRNQTLVIRVASRKTRQPGQLTAKVFIRNVPAAITELDVRALCSTFGTVQSCVVCADVQHSVAGSQVAYVSYAGIDSALKAASVLNNQRPWPCCELPLLAKTLDSNHGKRKKDDDASGTPGTALRSGGVTESPGMWIDSRAPSSASPVSLTAMVRAHGQQLMPTHNPGTVSVLLGGTTGSGGGLQHVAVASLPGQCLPPPVSHISAQLHVAGPQQQSVVYGTPQLMPQPSPALSDATTALRAAPPGMYSMSFPPMDPMMMMSPGLGTSPMVLYCAPSPQPFGPTIYATSTPPFHAVHTQSWSGFTPTVAPSLPPHHQHHQLSSSFQQQLPGTLTSHQILVTSAANHHHPFM